jgi:hypothetical protein
MCRLQITIPILIGFTLPGNLNYTELACRITKTTSLAPVFVDFNCTFSHGKLLIYPVIIVIADLTPGS